MSVLKNINFSNNEDDSFLIGILLNKEVDSHINKMHKRVKEKNSSFILCTLRILSHPIVNHSIRLYKLNIKNLKIKLLIFFNY